MSTLIKNKVVAQPALTQIIPANPHVVSAFSGFGVGRVYRKDSPSSSVAMSVTPQSAAPVPPQVLSAAKLLELATGSASGPTPHQYLDYNASKKFGS